MKGEARKTREKEEKKRSFLGRIERKERRRGKKMRKPSLKVEIS